MAKVTFGGPPESIGGSTDKRLPTSQIQPQVPPELVPYLERVFAPAVSRGRELRDYDRMVGHQEVLDHLRALVEQQKSRV